MSSMRVDSGPTSRSYQYRLLSIALLDMFFTLPFGLYNVINIGLTTRLLTTNNRFYPGWEPIHSDWAPVGVMDNNERDKAGQFVNRWSTVALAYAIFAIYGFTHERRLIYWKAISFIGKPFGRFMPSTQRKLFGEKSTVLSDFEARTRQDAVSSQSNTYVLPICTVNLCLMELP
jgi:hypothetical protein